MVVDTDVHHGNGTAAIFHNDPTVFTISIHQETTIRRISRHQASISTWPIRR